MEKFGPYILLEKVASGGMAELFRAKKIGIEGFERVLAIKRILPHLSSDEEFINMFIDEAKLVARLSHKNITQVYDFGKIDQSYYIAMEYVRGKDLRSILKRCHERNIRQPVALAVFIAREICSGLGYAHRQKDGFGKNLNIIHRDVSPQNILISYDGDVKVVDFGIAKAGSHSRTTTGVLKGKLSYMSPEQAWGRPIDHRSDIFSLGIVLYEMLTGERLFRGDSEINTLEKVREARVEHLPLSDNVELSAEIEKKMLKALAKETTERYQNAAEMGTDLGEVLFEILHADPAQSLKNFMHDLFRTEIEMELRADMEEETIRIQVDPEPPARETAVPAERTAVKPDAKTKTGPDAIQDAGSVEEKKGFPYAIAAAVATLVMVLLAFAFWPKNTVQPLPGKTGAATPVSSPVGGSELKKEGGSVPAGPAAAVTGTGEITGTAQQQKEIPPAADADKKEKNQKTTAGEPEGSLTVNAAPWANVFIKGKPYGTTPKTIEGLKPGKYQVRFENPNFDAWETKVTIAAGQVAKISHKFAGFGKLVVNASPWGNVYLDGTMKGQTPLTLDHIQAGRHVIRVGREGFADFEKSIELGAGATEQVSVTLKKDGG